MPMRESGQELTPGKGRLALLLGLLLVAGGSWVLAAQWPFVVALVDVYLGVGLLRVPYQLVAVLVVSIVFLLIYGAVRLLSSRWPWAARRPLVGGVLSLLALLLVAYLYPPMRAAWRAARFSDTPGSATVVIVRRTMGEVTKGVAWTGSEEMDWSNLPDAWPFNQLSPATTRMRTLDRDGEKVVLATLRASRFFALPEVLDPRPRQDHADLTIAVSRGGRIWRSSARLSDPGFELLDAVRGTLERQMAQPTPTSPGDSP